MQETLHANNVARIPWARCIKRAGAHFIQAECVGAKLVIHFVWRDDVLQALAHFPVFANYFFALPRVRAICFFNFVCGNGLTAFIAIGVCLNVTLVEQAMEWFFAAYMTKVVQHLVPEARVQQVQHCVLNSTHIQVHAAGVAVMLWSHPILLNVFINERFGIGWVEVAQFVPTRASPLRHHVYFTAILLRPIAKVKRDIDPVLNAGKRRNWVGGFVVRVECLWLEVSQFWQQNGQCRCWNRDWLIVFVVNNRERLTPVALTGEQPVAQLVGNCAVAVIVLVKPCSHQ